MKNLLVVYSSDCAKNGHVDPDFTNLVYGDSKGDGKIILNNLQAGSYVFFHTNIGGEKYITAYFYIEKILEKNKDKFEIECLKSHAKSDDVIIIGSRVHSKILTIPLKLDRALLLELESFNLEESYFNKKINDGYSELEAISHKTFNLKLLSDNDKEILLQKCLNRG